MELRIGTPTFLSLMAAVAAAAGRLGGVIATAAARAPSASFSADLATRFFPSRFASGHGR